MTTRSTRKVGHTCGCGAKLLWESRQTAAGVRWLALCSNVDCGDVTTRPDGSLDPDDVLGWFLLGHVETARYHAPWLRFYYRALTHRLPAWPYDGVCWDCEGEVMIAVGLPPTDPELGDGVRVLICLLCGATSVHHWSGGEWVAHLIDADDWRERTPQVVALAAALRQRIQPDEQSEAEFE